MNVDTSRFRRSVTGLLQRRRRRIESALGAIVLKVKADAVRLAPSDSSNLRGSAWANTENISGNIVGKVGFSAKYALFVHENLEQKGKGRKRSSGRGTTWNNGEPQFLFKSVIRNKEYIKRKLREAMQ